MIFNLRKENKIKIKKWIKNQPKYRTHKKSLECPFYGNFGTHTHTKLHVKYAETANLISTDDRMLMCCICYWAMLIRMTRRSRHTIMFHVQLWWTKNFMRCIVCRTIISISARFKQYTIATNSIHHHVYTQHFKTKQPVQIPRNIFFSSIFVIQWWQRNDERSS